MLISPVGKIIFNHLLNNFLPCYAYLKYIEILNKNKQKRGQNHTHIEKKLNTILLMYGCFYSCISFPVQLVHFCCTAENGRTL